MPVFHRHTDLDRVKLHKGEGSGVRRLSRAAQDFNPYPLVAELALSNQFLKCAVLILGTALSIASINCRVEKGLRK
jgi:hypothetical protein